MVLADGRVLSTLSTLRKDNTGYDLKSLFVGAEGTLGVITAASLKLFPRPRDVATAFVAVPDPSAAVELLTLLRQGSGDRIGSFELVPRNAVELTAKHVAGVTPPLGTASPWYVLVELTSPRADEGLGALLEAELARALGLALASDAALAQNERERQAFWRLRETIPEAQVREGASLKHDVSVPVASLPAFLGRASAWVATHVPDGVLVAYGHVGDGNLHFNVGQAPGADLARLQGAGTADPPRDPRPGARVRRQLQRRARHRSPEGRGTGALCAAGGARADARDQGRPRPQRHHESRQGAEAMISTFEPRMLHAMLRVHDLPKMLNFYCGVLGMRELRRIEMPELRRTLVFIGYAGVAGEAQVEFWHDWDTAGTPCRTRRRRATSASACATSSPASASSPPRASWCGASRRRCGRAAASSR